MNKKRLSEIEIGKKAVIISFESDEIILKLMEMGCLPGEVISVEKKAPWGDPISIIVSGYQLSLRMNEAEKIIVEEIIT
jgi:ferrous iron transport protein A